MRTLKWLFRGLLFFTLFAFALNNQQMVELHWFWGYKWQAPMVFIVLAVFALGCALGVLAMLPGWWRSRRHAARRDRMMPSPDETPSASTKGGGKGANSDAADNNAIPSQLPFPPDMPAPRKPAK